MKYLSTGHAVYSLKYHMVIITKYRRKVLSQEKIEYIKEVISSILKKNNGELLEINGEEDHIHILFEISPVVVLTKLICSIKTISSRMLRKEYKMESLRSKKGTLWSSSYFIATCGEVRLEILKGYIEKQGNKVREPRNKKVV